MVVVEVVLKVVQVPMELLQLYQRQCSANRMSCSCRVEHLMPTWMGLG